MTQSELSERLWIFDAQVGRMTAALPATPYGRQIAAQLIRPATSFAPRYDASIAAESRTDLIQRLTTSLTELRATRSWLRIIQRAELVPLAPLTELVAEANQLCRVLGTALRTAKNARTALPIARIMHEAELSERLWVFDTQLGKTIPALPKTGAGRRVARALQRSGTAFAPRYDESGAARSRSDLVRKLGIALKELRAIRGWLRFIDQAGLLPSDCLDALLHEANQLCRILGSHQRRAGKRLPWTPKNPASLPAKLLSP